MEKEKETKIETHKEAHKETHKVCKRCNINKETTVFTYIKRDKRFMSNCRQCEKVTSGIRRQKNILEREPKARKFWNHSTWCNYDLCKCHIQYNQEKQFVSEKGVRVRVYCTKWCREMGEMYKREEKKALQNTSQTSAKEVMNSLCTG